MGFKCSPSLCQEAPSVAWAQTLHSRAHRLLVPPELGSASGAALRLRINQSRILHSTRWRLTPDAIREEDK